MHTTVEARDEEGLEFGDLAAAKISAAAGAPFLVGEEMKQEHRFSPSHSIRITDTAGLLLHTTRYGDRVDVRL
ncbi:hypothetical protein [Sphingomonas bacterium]|uniref:DUF6894 family protein n=1 Tax=Sphingomonas bacterium TaxID=1895847 RepID=UPI00260E48E8|nr:hypothetical protein [Sphingomonas bacterium]